MAAASLCANCLRKSFHVDLERARAPISGVMTRSDYRLLDQITPDQITHQHRMLMSNFNKNLLSKEVGLRFSQQMPPDNGWIFALCIVAGSIALRIVAGSSLYVSWPKLCCNATQFMHFTEIARLIHAINQTGSLCTS